MEAIYVVKVCLLLMDLLNQVIALFGCVGCCSVLKVLEEVTLQPGSWGKGCCRKFLITYAV